MKNLSLICILFVCSLQSQNSEKIIPWNRVDKAPIFKGCLESENSELCSEQAFISFFKDEFQHELISESESDYSLNLRIIIGTDGKLKWSSVKTNSEQVKKEAERILSILPIYIPGSLSGEPVYVVKSYRIKLERKTDILDIKSVDVPPIPRNCQKESDKKFCLSRSVSHHVNSNFDTDVVRLTKKGINFFRSTASFVIDEYGKIINVKATGDNELMNQEAIRVVKNIPAMQPAQFNGKPVAVSYSLPITIGISR